MRVPLQYQVVRFIADVPYTCLFKLSLLVRLQMLSYMAFIADVPYTFLALVKLSFSRSITDVVVCGVALCGSARECCYF